jgi:hypothetical protein
MHRRCQNKRRWLKATKHLRAWRRVGAGTVRSAPRAGEGRRGSAAKFAVARRGFGAAPRKVSKSVELCRIGGGPRAEGRVWGRGGGSAQHRERCRKVSNCVESAGSRGRRAGFGGAAGVRRSTAKGVEKCRIVSNRRWAEGGGPGLGARRGFRRSTAKGVEMCRKVSNCVESAGSRSFSGRLHNGPRAGCYTGGFTDCPSLSASC